MRRRRAKQLVLPVPNTWGGRRKGAGRKSSAPRPGRQHNRRPHHVARHPLHITLRAVPDIPSLRSARLYADLARAIGASSRDGFRVVHYSVQTDHVHLIVEADATEKMTRGLRGLTVRTAKAINRRAGRRGQVWAQRYHSHVLRTPREMRNALAYVLLNFRKHLRAEAGIDPKSSGPWFEGWRIPIPPPANEAPVVSARTWLATEGWRRAGGPIDVLEGPVLQG